MVFDFLNNIKRNCIIYIYKKINETMKQVKTSNKRKKNCLQIKQKIKGRILNNSIKESIFHK